MTKLPRAYRPNTQEPYMNAMQQSYFRDRLTKLRDRLIRESKQSFARLLENGEVSADLIDQSVNNSLRNMDILNRRRFEQTLGQIDRALRRLDEGSYGYCLETEEEIGLPRLLANPLALLSIEAQEIQEKRLAEYLPQNHR